MMGFEDAATSAFSIIFYSITQDILHYRVCKEHAILAFSQEIKDFPQKKFIKRKILSVFLTFPVRKRTTNQRELTLVSGIDILSIAYGSISKTVMEDRVGSPYTVV
jgi:hypothetical protein